MEGPIFVGAYVRREICVSNSIGLACSGKEIGHFCFALLCIRGQIPSTSPRGAYIRRGDLTEGFLRYDFGGLIFGGACTWRGLFSEFYGSKFPHVGKSKTGFPSRHSGFHLMDSGSQVLYSSLCQWNLDPGFQSLVRFRIT